MEKQNYDNCPICSSRISEWKTKETDTGKYRIDRCVACGYAFVNPRPSFEFLMRYYSSHGHSHNKDTDNKSLELILEKEKHYPNSTIDARRIIKTIIGLSPDNQKKNFLDVGCGYGFFTSEALRNKFEVVALELASTEREIAIQMTGLIPVSTSFEEFEYERESFSTILMSQILEHAFDIRSWISKANNLLIVNGLLVIALPNFDSIFRLIMNENEPFICPPTHLNFFSPKNISFFLESQGFKVEKIQYVSRIPPQTFEKRIPMPAKMALPIINGMTGLTLKLLDVLHLGMIINVYARKTNT